MIVKEILWSEDAESSSSSAVLARQRSLLVSSQCISVPLSPSDPLSLPIIPFSWQASPSRSRRRWAIRPSGGWWRVWMTWTSSSETKPSRSPITPLKWVNRHANKRSALIGQIGSYMCVRDITRASCLWKYIHPNMNISSSEIRMSLFLHQIWRNVSQWMGAVRMRV